MAIRVIECIDCHDEGACSVHEMRDDPIGARVHCARCAGSGLFVTGTMNGKVTSPGGHCYRCSGKGYHTRADRRRNWGHARYALVHI